MRRFAAILGGTALLFGVGCTNLNYLKKSADGGVVQFKTGEEQQVVEKLKKEHGDIEVLNITDATAVTPGGTDPKAPVRPSDRMLAQQSSATTLFGQSEFGQMQLTYRKAAPKPATPGGLPPAPPDGPLKQASYTSAYDRPVQGSTMNNTNRAGNTPAPADADCKK